MNLKHKEHDLTEIKDFDNRILVYMYAEINSFGFMCNWKKGYVLQGLIPFFIDQVRSVYLFIYGKSIL